MWPFKTKYDKLKRDEVVDAIYQLEKQEEIDFLLTKGKKEKSEELKLLYAKKINHLKQELQNDISKGSYLLYNISLLKRLKEAIDDKQFFKTTTKVSLGALLKDQNGLAKFLNQALNTKVAAEDVLTSADETFNEIQGAYEPNKDIYGVTKSDDELLAVFETQEDDLPEIQVKEERPQIEESETPLADKIDN